MNYTPNLNLKKPAKTDPVLIDDLNENADIIDQKLKESEDHVNNKNNPHNVTAEQVGAVSKSGDTMTGPLRVGRLVIRDLNSETGSSPEWWKLVRIQDYLPPSGGSENVSFSGQMIVQSDFGRTADKQGIYTFSFGARGNNINPVLFTAGNAAPIGNDTPRFQIWCDTDGWHYLYFQQPRYSKFCQFIYSYNGNAEYWIEENPQQVSGLTLVWDSATDPVQDIYVGANKVWHAGNFDPNTSIPPGVIMAYAGTTVPKGWLECNGQAVSRTTYSALFAAIGTTWGAGNGSTTFNVPDLRGEFLRGWDHGRGVDGGRAFGSFQTDAIQNITGSWNGQGKADRLEPSGAFYCQANSSREEASNHDGARMYFDASRVVRTANETRPRNRAVMYIIKY